MAAKRKDSESWLKAFNAKAGEQLAVLAAGLGVDVEVTPTGVLALDAALGVGGWPLGRVVEIFGGENSGKTTLAALAVAAAQAAGRPTLYVDAEHKLDLRWLQKLGVDLSRMGLSQPSSGEKGFKALRTLMAIGGGLGVVDSVTTMTPQAVIDARDEGGKDPMAAHARLMSQELAALVGGGEVARTRTTLLFLNQTRSKVGVFYGNPMTTTGGNALRFYSVQRVEFLSAQKVTGATSRGKDVVGVRARAKVVKNQTAPPFKHAEWTLLGATGLDRGLDHVETAIAYGVLRRSTKKSPAITFAEDGYKIGASLDKAAAAVAADVGLRAKIRDAVLQAVRDADARPAEENAVVDEIAVDDDDGGEE